ncbi:hypothetical protein [Sphingobium sp. B11D3D]|uniref:hypothetical protein n=1 Tax=Sphingobium sp. B11D3D TaxID=2940576 RepID=UPI00222568DF|nr:hypothetical protein [Sphingobium sp. B11D3D]MCW2370059.1 hypothetical protein [Sphingobium sp. B11D3D]
MTKLERMCTTILLAVGAISNTGWAQDYNYVPGWANTTNHQYKGEESGEWKAKTELFKVLGAQSAASRCTLQNLSEADGNVIVNQYRSRERKTDTPTALKVAQQQVNAHHKRMRAQGKC